MMKWVLLSIAALCLIIGCQSKQKKQIEEDIAIALPDSVRYSLHREDSGFVLRFENWKPDSPCVFFRQIWASGDSTVWFEFCSTEISKDSFFIKGDTRLNNPQNSRAKIIETYIEVWREDLKYRNNGWQKYGFDVRTEDGMLTLYDSTLPITQPESLECKQALAAFRSYWREDVTGLSSVNMLGEFDPYCVDTVLATASRLHLQLIEFSGTYNEAAVELERVVPLSFINLIPWCDGMKSKCNPDTLDDIGAFAVPEHAVP